MDRFEFLKAALDHITVNGKPLSRRQRDAVLLSGQLPKGAKYPAILDPNTHGHGSRTQQALLFAGKDRSVGVASGPYGVATGDENFFAARQIRPIKAKP